MKKVRIIVPAVFVIIVIELLTAYAIYGSTLIDITSVLEFYIRIRLMKTMILHLDTLPNPRFIKIVIKTSAKPLNVQGVGF